MKILKYTGLAILTLLVIVVLYANTRSLSPADKLPPVTLVTFDVKGQMTPEVAKVLHSDISKVPGVTACAINADGHVASVTFNKTMTTESFLKTRLSFNDKFSVTTKVFEPSSGGCPVHGISASFNAMISLLDLRI
jgi:hypothetical protein